MIANATGYPVAFAIMAGLSLLALPLLAAVRTRESAY